jgi:hypothetical protein
MERFLYRLCKLLHADSVLLNGALLLTIWIPSAKGSRASRRARRVRNSDWSASAAGPSQRGFWIVSKKTCVMYLAQPAGEAVVVAHEGEVDAEFR